MQVAKRAKNIVIKNGGVFIRKTKHGSLFRLLDNRTILISSTPSSDGWLKDLEKRILDSTKILSSF